MKKRLIKKIFKETYLYRWLNVLTKKIKKDKKQNNFSLRKFSNLQNKLIK